MPLVRLPILSFACLSLYGCKQPMKDTRGGDAAMTIEITRTTFQQGGTIPKLPASLPTKEYQRYG
jgi:hypothetical protein